MQQSILTKDMIFSRCTAEDIYLKFLNRTEFPKGNISSPFSEDKKPSFKLYPDGRFKCYSTGKKGDVFQFVAELKQLDCNSQFIEVLEEIVNKMNITFLDQSKESIKVAATDKKPSKLTVEKREFTSLDLQYWENLGVAKEVLIQCKVSSVSSYSWTGKKPIYTKKEAVAFAFELHGNYKLYIPSQPELGIKKNVLPPFPSGVFGFEQIGSEKIENLIICAGEKDTITAISRGFNAVTFGSETINPTKEQISRLQTVCKRLFVCFDNDNAGEKGRNELIKRFPEIIPLQLPQNEAVKGYDITDYFQEHTAEDFQRIIDLAMNKKRGETENNDLTTIFHIAENYLRAKYDLRYNVISLEIEISLKDQNQWISCNENTLWLEIQKKNIKIPINSLIAILKSSFVPNYNPLVNYFENLPEWDNATDYIKEFSEYVKLETGESKEQFEYHFKKWCVRAVKCATIDNYFNKQAFILTDDGNGQNIGKSSWCRFLCPEELSNYLAEDMSDDKDARILLCKNFLINLDELAALSRKEINQLKAYFSKAQINERLPYDRKNSIIQRVASFIGSTNMSTFLQDETGSVRWLCFIVKKIDWSYKNEFNINNLWAQAYVLSKDKNFDETLSLEDIRQNEIRNEKFQIISPERDLIHKFFEIPDHADSSEFLTSTEILHHINLHTASIRLSNVGIGKALKSVGFKRSKHNQVYGYWIKKKIV